MNPVALVTGGASGIGLGISFALAKEGYHLAICGRRSLDCVDNALDRLKATGVVVRYYSCDITSSEDRAQLLASIKADYGGLHVLVNNAGVAPEKRVDMLDATVDSFDRVININLKGPYFLTQAVARWMAEEKEAFTDYRGCIINISSVSVVLRSIGVNIVSQKPESAWQPNCGQFDWPNLGSPYMK